MLNAPDQARGALRDDPASPCDAAQQADTTNAVTAPQAVRETNTRTMLAPSTRKVSGIPSGTALAGCPSFVGYAFDECRTTGPPPVGDWVLRPRHLRATEKSRSGAGDAAEAAEAGLRAQVASDDLQPREARRIG